MLDPIEEYLREQSAEGHRDSTGAFTISAEKAMTKLAAFQLPRPSAWLLKVVQAGVVAGCSSINVNQSAKSSKVTFTGGHLGRIEELVKIFADPNALLTPAQQHLLVGLRTVALNSRRPVLVIDEPVDSPRLCALWNEGRVSPPRPGSVLQKSLSARDEGNLSFHVGDSPLTEQYQFKREKGVKRVVADEYRELMANAVTCPIPLKVDGRRIDHFGLEDASFHRCPVLFGGRPGQAGEPVLRLSAAVLPEGAEDNTYAAAWTAYLTEKSHSNEICWVKDGVICESTTFGGHESFYLRLYLPADDLATDLSGLHLRFEDSLSREKRILSGLKAFEESSPEIAAEKTLPFRGSLGSGRSSTWWGAAALTLGGALLLPVTLGGSALGAFGLLGMKVADRKSQEAYERKMKIRFPQWARTLSSEFRAH